VDIFKEKNSMNTTSPEGITVVTQYLIWRLVKKGGIYRKLYLW
jgi:hypothetical protein